MKKLEFNLKTVLVANISQADVETLKTLMFLKSNRLVAKNHINNIKNSFLTFGTACATIIVIETSAFGKKQQFIADGQHRVIAAIDLGLPLNINIVRLEDDTKANVIRFISILNNTSRGWMAEQYLLSFSDCDLPIYKKLAEVKNNSKLKITDLHFIYLNNNSKLVKAYRNGTLTDLPNEERSNEVYKATTKVFDFIPNKAFTRRAFYSVISDITELDRFTDIIIETSKILKSAEMNFSENEQDFKQHLLRLKKLNKVK